VLFEKCTMSEIMKENVKIVFIDYTGTGSLIRQMVSPILPILHFTTQFSRDSK
jgi:hypothetical protein